MIETREARPNSVAWSVARLVLGALFVVSVPVTLVVANVRWLVGDASHWHAGYVKYDVPLTTGMPLAQLDEATLQLQRYFATGTPMTIQIDKGRGLEPLFNARETQHLADVRTLLTFLYRLQVASLVYVVLFAVAARWLLPPRPWRSFFRYLAGGAGLTLGVLATLGLLAQLNFDDLFVKFHELSFDNDLWILDWRTDWMIRMYPQGFWFDSALRLATWTIAQALLILVSALMLARRQLARFKF